MVALEAKFTQSVGPSTWVNQEKLVKSSNGFLRVSSICNDKKKLQLSFSSRFSKTNFPPLDVSCSCTNYRDSVMKSTGFPMSLDESSILKNKCAEIGPKLYGRCIYLVGMMGSGKTTIGKILADALGYSSVDSDVLVEHAVGLSIPEIFRDYGEGFFRENETEVLQKLSSMQRFVVATGGGAVVRPINWKCMRNGISIWLDVSLEALAHRITAIGTNSRPLLHQGTEDEFSRTFMRLEGLMQERAESYANANARVSLDCIAAKLGYGDVLNLSPAVIAIEALKQIESVVKDDQYDHI